MTNDLEQFGKMSHAEVLGTTFGVAAVTSRRLSMANTVNDVTATPLPRTERGSGLTVYDTAVVLKSGDQSQLYSGTITLTNIAMQNSSIAGPTPSGNGEVSVREELRKFSPLQQQRLSAYVLGAAPELHREQAAKARRADQEWFPWLISKASHRDLLRLAEWHVDTLASLQNNSEIQDAIQAEKEDYARFIGVSIGREVISESAQNVVDYIGSAPVYISDPFDPDFKNDTLDGYCSSDGDYVAIVLPVDRGYKPGNEALLATITETLPHEFNHLFFESDCDYGWPISESKPEHLAISWKHGKPKDLRPLARPAKPGVYQAERLLDRSLNQGIHGTVDPFIGTRAYSGTHQEKDNYEQSLDSAWGVTGMLHKTSALARRMRDSHMKANPTGETAIAEEKAAKTVRRRLDNFRKGGSESNLWGPGFIRR